MSTRNIAGFGIEVVTGSGSTPPLIDLSGLQRLITSVTDLTMRILTLSGFKLDGGNSVGAVQMKDAFGSWFEPFRLFYHFSEWESVQMQAPASTAAVTVRKHTNQVNLDGDITRINTATTQIGVTGTNTTTITGDLILDKGWTFASIKAQKIGGALWDWIKAAYIDATYGVRISFLEPANGYGFTADTAGSTIQGPSTAVGSFNVQGAVSTTSTITATSTISTGGAVYDWGYYLPTNNHTRFGKSTIQVTLPTLIDYDEHYPPEGAIVKLISLTTYMPHITDPANQIFGITAHVLAPKNNHETGDNDCLFDVRPTNVYRATQDSIATPGGYYYNVYLTANKATIRLTALMRDSAVVVLGGDYVGSENVRGLLCTIEVFHQKP